MFCLQCHQAVHALCLDGEFCMGWASSQHEWVLTKLIPIALLNSHIGKGTHSKLICTREKMPVASN